MDPVAFRIGPLDVYWYGITIAVGMMAGVLVSTWEAKRRGEDPSQILNAMFLALALGLIGARLYHVFSSPNGYEAGWDFYRQHPLAILNLRSGGLGIFGAIIGGLTGLLIYVRWKGLSFLRWADIGMVGLPLGQAIGRWGNFFNQELYGYPTELPWGIYISPERRLPGLESEIPVNLFKKRPGLHRGNSYSGGGLLRSTGAVPRPISFKPWGFSCIICVVVKDTLVSFFFFVFFLIGQS